MGGWEGELNGSGLWVDQEEGNRMRECELDCPDICKSQSSTPFEMSASNDQ